MICGKIVELTIDLVCISDGMSSAHLTFGEIRISSDLLKYGSFCLSQKVDARFKESPRPVMDHKINFSNNDHKHAKCNTKFRQSSATYNISHSDHFPFQRLPFMLFSTPSIGVESVPPINPTVFVTPALFQYRSTTPS